jgi:hypothetical protein
MTVTVKLILTPSGKNPLDGLNDVIDHIEARFIATDGDLSDSSAYEGVAVGAPDPANFKPVADLTPADYLAMVKYVKGADYDAWYAEKSAAAIAMLTRPAQFILASVEAP